MKDQWMNDCLVVYIKKNVAHRIDNKEIILQFQYMKHHRKQLQNFMYFGFFFFWFCFL